MHLWCTVVTKDGLLIVLIHSWCTVVTEDGLSTVQCIHGVQWWQELIGVVCSGDWRRLELSIVHCIHDVQWWLKMSRLQWRLEETGIVHSSMYSWSTLVNGTVWGCCLQFNVVTVLTEGDWSWHGQKGTVSGILYSSVYSWCSVAVKYIKGVQWWLEETEVSVFMRYNGDWSRLGLSAKVTPADLGWQVYSSVCLWCAVAVSYTHLTLPTSGRV